jgi:hypothetical protein
VNIRASEDLFAKSTLVNTLNDLAFDSAKITSDPVIPIASFKISAKIVAKKSGTLK